MARTLATGVGSGGAFAIVLRFLHSLEVSETASPLDLCEHFYTGRSLHYPSVAVGVIVGFLIAFWLEALIGLRTLVLRWIGRRLRGHQRPYFRLL